MNALCYIRSIIVYILQSILEHSTSMFHMHQDENGNHVSLHVCTQQDGDMLLFFSLR